MSVVNVGPAAKGATNDGGVTGDDECDEGDEDPDDVGLEFALEFLGKKKR